jgi:hypothetical protein
MEATGSNSSKCINGLGTKLRLVFPSSTPLEPLSHIGHDRNCCPLDLSTQAIVLSEICLAGDYLDLLGQPSRLLPRNEILKSFYLTHHSPPAVAIKHPPPVDGSPPLPGL